MDSKLFELGNCVTLKNNYLLDGAHSEILALGGVPTYVTPIMVVVEIFHNPQKDFDPSTGELFDENSPNSSTKYKCCWFSTKSMTLEYNWFKAIELVKFKVNLPKKHSKDLKIGDTVRFDTVDEEAAKLKSLKSSERKIERSQPLLSFVAPAFLVIGWAKYEIKDSLMDAQTGLKIRWISQKLVKCKFYNESSEKFSEILIPVECLHKIDIQNELLHSRIDQLVQAKSENMQIWFNYGTQGDLGTFQDISVLSGRYQARFVSIITGKVILVWLDELNILSSKIKLSSEFSEGYPIFRTENQPKPTFLNADQYVSEKSNELEGKIVYIGYKNLKDEFRYRFIKIHNFHELGKTKDGKPIFILSAYCFFRSEMRMFSSKGLISIQSIKEESPILALWKEPETNPEKLNEDPNDQNDESLS